MIKKLAGYFMFALFAVSCGNTKQESSSQETTDPTTTEITNQNEGSTNEVIKEEIVAQFGEDGTYVPPFEFTASHEYVSGWASMRETFTAKLLKNGKVKGSYLNERKRADGLDSNAKEWWEEESSSEFTGKWSTTSIRMGDGYQTVYCIDTTISKYSWYLPDDADYIWAGSNAYYNCENYNVNDGIKVIEIKPIK